MNGLQLIATGGALPGRTITNDALSRMVDTSDAWITSRTGIRTRHWCTEDESAATLAIAAARQALDRSGLAPADIACCVCATLSAPDATPSVACQVQAALGLPENRPALDINAACSGFLYGMAVARGMLTTLGGQYALVIGCEALSRLMDPTDRSTCVLFGDGAGATVVRAADALYGASLGADGTGYGLMFCKNPPPASPFTHNPPEQDAVYSRPEGPGHMVMGGREVYKFATKVMPQSLLQACEKAGIQAGELDWIVPHQANVRIVQTAMDRLGLPMEKAWMTIDHTGNTSSASIPIALDELHRAGRVRRGDKIGLSGFGAGLIYASLVFEW